MRQKSEKKLTEVLLINEELLKLYSPISKNVGIDKIVPYINLAQPFYITPILGDALTEELQAEIYYNNLSEHNKALILKIAAPLSLWSTYLAMRSLTYSITEKGIQKAHSENSESINEKELGYFILDVKEKAEMATEVLIKYLCNCSDLYPLWRPHNDCNCSKYNPTEGTNEIKHKNLVYFPNKKQKKCCK